MEKMYADVNVKLNPEGYLEDFSQWNKEVAMEIAAQENIQMTGKHWEVIEYLQEQYRNNVPLSIRKIGKSGIVNIKEFYTLFPNGPLKISTKIAGIPKPVSCI